MKEKQLSELLDKHIEDYINSIAIELEEAHDRWFENFGFPMFGTTSKQYHEQVYFQSYFESYTRQLINGSLKEIIKNEVSDEIIWPEDEYKGMYQGYTNTEYEREFGFEFINHESKVGYRYSFFHHNEIESLLAKGNVNSIVLVLFENKEELIGFEYDDERVKAMLLTELFHDLFPGLGDEEVEVMYEVYTRQIKAAVDQANSMISFTTVPGFTSCYIYKTRKETITNLKKEIMALSCFSVNNNDFKKKETESKKLIDVYKLHQYFLENEFENAFVGTSDFAKSYMTSEYLFHYFKNNPMFDYTPIVSCYLKSIEQLLHAICSSYCSINNIQKDLSNHTLGNYIAEIKQERLFRGELVSAKRIIVGCLNSYRVESRNNLFHKDYFNKWDKVEQIRKNTIFLYVVLLGSVEPTVIMEDSSVLSLINIEYDQMFRVIDEQKNNLFSFILDSKEYCDMRKEPRSKGLVFNKDGLIKNSVLFSKHNYDHLEQIEISRDRMPSEVWITDMSGKKKRIWQVKK